MILWWCQYCVFIQYSTFIWYLYFTDKLVLELIFLINQLVIITPTY